MLRIEKNFLNIRNILNVIQDEKITKTELKILLLLIEEIKKPNDIIIMSRKRIIKKTNIDEGNLSRILNRLVSLKLIEKQEIESVYKIGSLLYEDIDFKKSKV